MVKILLEDDDNITEANFKITIAKFYVSVVTLSLTLIRMGFLGARFAVWKGGSKNAPVCLKLDGIKLVT